ncbi:MAG: DUF6291 domain-containing protein [Treponema sp.]|jgi:hypothetical protein|nr:DUF6291 domain-containing protein [Treponema sp.]
MSTDGKFFASFIVCETTHKQLKKMSPEMRLRFYDALFEFGINGVEPDFEGLEEIVWIPMMDFILNSKRADEEWHAKQRVNGKKGGAPKGNTNAKKPGKEAAQNNPLTQKQPVDSETTSCFETTHNVNGNVNDNNNVNSNSNEKEREREKSAEAHEQPPFLRPKVFEETLRKLIPPEQEREPSPVEQAPKPAEPDESSPARKFDTWYEDIRRTWNALVHNPPANIIALNLNDFERRDIIAIWKTYPQPEVVRKSIANYVQVKDCPEKYDPHGSVYDSLSGFLKKGIEKYCDESQPLKRYILPSYQKQQEEDERKRRDNERTLEMIRKAREKRESVA